MKSLSSRKRFSITKVVSGGSKDTVVSQKCEDTSRKLFHKYFILKYTYAKHSNVKIDNSISFYSAGNASLASLAAGSLLKSIPGTDTTGSWRVSLR